MFQQGVHTTKKSPKNKKETGLDNVTVELLKAELNTLTHIMHPIITKVWEHITAYQMNGK